MAPRSLTRTHFFCFIFPLPSEFLLFCCVGTHWINGLIDRERMKNVDFQMYSVYSPLAHIYAHEFVIVQLNMYS